MIPQLVRACNMGNSQSHRDLTSSPSDSGYDCLPTSGNTGLFGAWEELHPGVGFEVSGFLLTFRHFNTVDGSNMLIEIGVGAAAAERTLLTIPHGGSNFVNANGIGDVLHWVPLALPPSTRLAARVMSTQVLTANNVGLRAVLLPSTPFMPGGFRGIEAFGVPSGTPTVTGTTITSGAGFVSARAVTTTQRWRAWGVAFQSRALAASPQAMQCQLRETVGGTVLSGTLPIAHSGRGSGLKPGLLPLPCDIPAGTAVGLFADVYTTASADVAPILYGFY